MYISILIDAAFTPQEGTQQVPPKQGELLGPPSSDVLPHFTQVSPVQEKGLEMPVLTVEG